MIPIGVRARATVASLVLLMLVVPVVPAAAAPVAAPSAHVRPASVNDFEFESFEADYHLSLDADGQVVTRVVETIVAVFPPNQNKGIIRAIPDEARGYRLDQRMLSITDEHGNAVYWEQYDTSEYDVDTGRYIPFVEYYLGTDEYVQGRTTYVLEYSLESTIHHFDDAGGPAGVDEFYWDVNGDGWMQTFGEVTARIHLAPELRDALTGVTGCFVGTYGSDGGCDLNATRDGYEVTVGPVYAYSTLTVAIAFEGGTVVQRTQPQDSWIVQIAPKAIFGIVLAMIVGAIVLRATRWRDPRPGTIIAQYEPPEPDILVSAQIIRRPHSGLSALLIDFAVRGILRIIDNQPDATGGDLKNRYELELLDSSTTSTRELKVIKLLFGKDAEPGEQVNPGRISPSTGAALYGLTADAARYADSQGYRSLPSDRGPKIMRRIAGWSLLLFVPIWVYAFWFDVPDTGPITLFMWLSIFGFFVLLFLLVRRKQLTAKGAQLRDHLLGMREYLTVAEEDRLRVLQSPQGAQRRIDPSDREAIVHLYERLLPYAVLWGVEREWAEQLRMLYREEAPVWLASGSLTPAFLTSFSTSTMSKVHPIVTSSSSGSSWSSSGGSSFSSSSSGGGFSGGGGGGGGGGGR